MAVDMFLKIDGVEGGHIKGEIEVLSFAWGINQAATQQQGGGAGAGKVNVQDFLIAKRVDQVSPKLMEMCCRGEHVSFATLTLRKAGDKQQDYFTIKMTDALISSYQTGGGGGGTEPTEQVSFSFANVQVSALEQKADGSIGGAVSSSSCHFGK